MIELPLADGADHEIELVPFPLSDADGADGVLGAVVAVTYPDADEVALVPIPFVALTE